MNQLRKLLGALTIFGLTATGSLATVACFNGTNKTNLGDIKLEIKDQLIAPKGKKYAEIDVSSLANDKQFKEKTLAKGFTAKFFENDGKTEIKSDAEIENTGIYDLHVQLIADANDPNWQGATKISTVILNVKNAGYEDLKDTILDFAKDTKFDAVIGEKYSTIISSDETKKLIINNKIFGDKKLDSKFTVKYFNQDKNEEITGKPIVANITTINIKVFAANEDQNWIGETNYSQITLDFKKVDIRSDLKNINSLTLKNNIEVDLKATYSSIDKMLFAAAVEFGQRPLSKDFDVYFFDKNDLEGTTPINGTEITENTKVNVQLRALQENKNWYGQTPFLSINIYVKNL